MGRSMQKEQQRKFSQSIVKNDPTAGLSNRVAIWASLGQATCRSSSKMGRRPPQLGKCLASSSATVATISSSALAERRQNGASQGYGLRHSSAVRGMHGKSRLTFGLINPTSLRVAPATKEIFERL